MSKTFALVSLLLAGAIVPASADDLSGKEIKSLIAGKRVYLSTPYGVELPLAYGKNGNVKGDVSGIALASMFAPSETGRWWIEGKRLCQKWPSWYKGKTICFTIRKTGARTISWKRDDGLAGTARISG